MEEIKVIELTRKVFEALQGNRLGIRLGTDLSCSFWRVYLRESFSLDEVNEIALKSLKFHGRRNLRWYREEIINRFNQKHLICIRELYPPIFCHSSRGFLIITQVSVAGFYMFFTVRTDSGEEILEIRPLQIPASIFPLTRVFSEYVKEIERLYGAEFYHGGEFYRSIMAAEHILAGLVVYYSKAFDKIDYFEDFEGISGYIKALKEKISNLPLLMLFWYIFRELPWLSDKFKIDLHEVLSYHVGLAIAKALAEPGEKNRRVAAELLRFKEELLSIFS